MADTPAAHSDEEEGEGEGEEGDDDEGEEEGGDDEEEATEAETGHDGDHDHDQDHEMHDSPASEPVQPVSIEEPEDTSPGPLSDQDALDRPRSKPSNSLNLVPPHLNSPRLEGSPLKNTLSTSRPLNQSPAMSPSFHASSFSNSIPMEVDSTPDLASQPALDLQDSPFPMGSDMDFSAPLSGVADDGASDIPIGSDAGAALDRAFGDLAGAPEELHGTPDIDMTASELEKVEEIEHPPMDADKATTPPPITEPAVEPQVSEKESTPAPVPDDKEAEPELAGAKAGGTARNNTEPQQVPEQVEQQELEKEEEREPTPAAATREESPKDEARPDIPVEEPAALDPEPPAPAPPPAPTAEDEDDGMPDLLGGLERELDRQAGVSGGEEAPDEGNATELPSAEAAKEAESEKEAAEKPAEV